jgi:hypothetical protein
VVETTGDEPWITTKLDAFVNWGRKNSLWPMPFGTACCAIEFMATAASKYDLARFGMERQAVLAAPGRSADLRGSSAVQARAGASSDLAADAATQVVHLDGRLRVHRRNVRQLRRSCRESTASFRWMFTSRLSAAALKVSCTAS